MSVLLSVSHDANEQNLFQRRAFYNALISAWPVNPSYTTPLGCETRMKVKVEPRLSLVLVSSIIVIRETTRK